MKKLTQNEEISISNIIQSRFENAGLENLTDLGSKIINRFEKQLELDIRRAQSGIYINPDRISCATIRTLIDFIESNANNLNNEDTKLLDSALMKLASIRSEIIERNKNLACKG